MNNFMVGKYSYEIAGNDKVIVRLQQKDSTSKTYCELNIGRLSCSCSQFNEFRGSYPTNDPRRFCRHLIDLLAHINTLPENLKQYTGLIHSYSGKSGGVPSYKYKVDTFINGQRCELLSDSYSSDISPQYSVGICFDSNYYIYYPNIDKWAYAENWVTPGPPPFNEQIVEWVKSQIKKFK